MEDYNTRRRIEQLMDEVEALRDDIIELKDLLIPDWRVDDSDPLEGTVPAQTNGED